jgi:hypothetical protein
MAAYEDYGNRYGKSPHIEYALIDGHINDEDFRYGFRAGRVRLTMGMFNDKRTNPGLRELDFPPQALYREQLKHTALSGDGIQLYAGKMFNMVSFDAEVSHIKADMYPQEDAVNTLFNVPLGSGKFSDGQVKSKQYRSSANL